MKSRTEKTRTDETELPKLRNATTITFGMKNQCPSVSISVHQWLTPHLLEPSIAPNVVHSVRWTEMFDAYTKEIIYGISYRIEWQ
jgi:hypothetical protein